MLTGTRPSRSSALLLGRFPGRQDGVENLVLAGVLAKHTFRFFNDSRLHNSKDFLRLWKAKEQGVDVGIVTFGAVYSKCSQDWESRGAVESQIDSDG